MTRKFQDVYLPTLKANFVLWPAVQILNFRVVPIQFQIVSTIVTDLLCAVILMYFFLPALRVLRRNRLDCVSVADQLFGGGVMVVAGSYFGSHKVPNRFFCQLSVILPSPASFCAYWAL